jgi:hypothetical protein
MQQVLTLTNNGSKGVVLKKKYYNIMRDFIIASFESRSQISFEFLMAKAAQFNAIYPIDNSMWYLLKVKQDMQARGILRVKFIGSPPRVQMLKINRKNLEDWYALLDTTTSS